jgi:hypothetical protein
MAIWLTIDIPETQGRIQLAPQEWTEGVLFDSCHENI